MSVEHYQSEYVWSTLSGFQVDRIHEIVAQVSSEFGTLMQDYHIENIADSGASSTPGNPRESDYFSWVSWGGRDEIDPVLRQQQDRRSVPCQWDLRKFDDLRDFYNYLLKLNEYAGKKSVFSEER
jgi:inhibitor of KinA sporulation pathway (predicted exonuclease)